MIWLIALGLAMDAFAVAIACGITIQCLQLRHALRIAGSFGAFQAGMPILGWWSGAYIQGWIEPVDHWIAFSVLSFLGIKMIREARRPLTCESPQNPLQWRVLLGLSVATSLDALAVGFSLSCVGVTIWKPAIIIGMVTFFVSFAGTWIGDSVGHFFETRIEIAGGIVLIAIGLKILIDHLLG